MTLTIQIPDDVERALAAEAEREGLSVDDYALRVLSAGRGASALPQDGPGLVDYWRAADLIGARADADDAPGLARQIRGRAEHRARG